MFRSIFFLGIFTLFTSPSHANEILPAFKALYSVTNGSMELGKATRELSYSPSGELIYASQTRTTGLAGLLYSDRIQETSQLKLANTGIRPVSYQFQRKRKSNRNLSQSFDWRQNTVTSSLNGAVHEYSVKPGVIDKNGFQIKLMLELAGGARHFRYDVAGDDGIETYEIFHVGDQRIPTALGELNTVVLRHKGKKRTTTLWCAEDLFFLPVKFQHEDKGKTYTANIRALKGLEHKKPF